MHGTLRVLLAYCAGGAHDDFARPQVGLIGFVLWNGERRVRAAEGMGVYLCLEKEVEEVGHNVERLVADNERRSIHLQGKR